MSFAIGAPADLLIDATPPTPPPLVPAVTDTQAAGDSAGPQTGTGDGRNSDRRGGEESARDAVTRDAEAQQRLTEAEQREVQALRARDREVRAHEAAHAAAAGGLARGAPSYTFERGPDGRQYAVGGEVQIDTAPVAGDPRATLEKAQQIQRAALAPGEPSAQDRAVAAAAVRMAAEARVDIADGAKLSCPECGGDHDSAVHQALSAYAGVAATGQTEGVDGRGPSAADAD